jgi:hypothetical protein
VLKRASHQPHFWVYGALVGRSARSSVGFGAALPPPPREAHVLTAAPHVADRPAIGARGSCATSAGYGWRPIAEHEVPLPHASSVQVRCPPERDGGPRRGGRAQEDAIEATLSG